MENAQEALAAYHFKMPQVPDRAGLERYIDFAPIGKGGFGEVFRVVDTESGDKVALKVVACEKGSEGFQRANSEIINMVQVRSPYVVRCR